MQARERVFSPQATIVVFSMRLQPLKKSFDTADAQARQARATADVLQARLQASEQAMAEAEVARSRAQGELHSLDEQVRSIRAQETSSMEEQLQTLSEQQKIKRAEISAALLSKQQADADRQAAEQAMQAEGKSLTEIATEAEQGAIEQFKNMPTLKN